MTDAGWVTRTIGEVCEMNPSRRELQGLPNDMEVTFVPMAAVSEDGKLINKRARELKDVKKGFPHFRERDVLVAKITPCFENGKRWLAAGLTNGIGFGSTEFHIIRAKDGVLPEWVYYLISTPKFRRDGKNRMTGTAGQKRIPPSFIQNYEIPVPSIQVQHKIVEILRRAENLRALRNEANYITNKAITSVFLKMFGDPDANPMGWEVKNIGELVTCLDAKRVPVKESERVPGNTPYYGANGQVGWIEGFIFDCPLLLLAEDGGDWNKFGKSAYRISGRSWVNNHAHVLLETQRARLEFLETCLNSSDLTRYISGTTRGKLTRRLMNTIRIPTPPLELQDNFVRTVKKIESIRFRQAEEAQEVDQLFLSLMDHAFKGELKVAN
jgi:type I restriction enzyme, S subunit